MLNSENFKQGLLKCKTKVYTGNSSKKLEILFFSSQGHICPGLSPQLPTWAHLDSVAQQDKLF